MRSLRKWSGALSACFPPRGDIPAGTQYWNWKIPVNWALVEGRYSTRDMRRECAQLLIDACSALISAKPAWAKEARVTCCICWPDMFTSEVCIYFDEGYYRSKMGDAAGERRTRISGRSLAAEWGLVLPGNVAEVGTHWRHDAAGGADDRYASDHWMYGEV